MKLQLFYALLIVISLLLSVPSCLLTDKQRVSVQAWTYAIQQSCLNKAAVVAADEREGGVRATLNLGHTFGHAMETGQGYGGTFCHPHYALLFTTMHAHIISKWTASRATKTYFRQLRVT